MTTTATTQNTFIEALVDALRARAGLAGKQITSAELDLEQSIPDAIAVIGINDGNESWWGIGNHRRQETYTVDMGCLVVRPGAGETVIRSALDDAYTLYNEVCDEVRRTPTLGGAKVAQVSSCNLDQGYSDQGRWVILRWGIGVTAYIEIV